MWFGEVGLPYFAYPAASSGFAVEESSLGSLLQDIAVLTPSEKVSVGEFDLLGPDNLRVSNPKYADAHYWLELAPNGQYSSHRFDPVSPSAPSLIQRFVYADHKQTATFVGRPETWYCLNGEHGIVCDHGTRDHVAGQYIPNEQ
ncbi:hypothetical protein HMPREF3101_03885 [Corynebacterium sp. HMSC29G08]|nr:hypothetical protein HMPREF3101_03885 [Corynebacterium sp. HMSC29G08]